MSAILFDGAETQMGANDVWTQVGWTLITSSPTPRTGSVAYQQAGTATFRILGADAHATMIVGFAFYASSVLTGPLGFDLASSGNINTASAVRLLHSSGQLNLYVRNTLVASTPANTIYLNTWHYVEFKVVSALSGSAVVRVDGATLINYSGDTRYSTGGTVIPVRLVFPDAGAAWWHDDIYLLNGVADADGLDDFIGDIRIYALTPNGNGNSSQFTGSDGNSTDNYLLGDEIPHSDADYVESATVGHIDLYTMTNLPTTVQSVVAVVPEYRALRTDTDFKNIRRVLRHSAANYVGADRALPATAAHLTEILTRNPGTSAVWTVSDVDGMELGMEVR